MKALVYTADRVAEFRDEPDPRPEPGEVLLRVRTVGICGSDLHGWMGRQAKRRPPLILGHEALGEVLEAPGNETRFQPGMRVVVNPLFSCGYCANCRAGRANTCVRFVLLGFDGRPGAMAEKLTAPASNCHPLAETVSNEAAAVMEPLAVAVHLMRLAPPMEDGTLAVFGAGTVGALIVRVAALLGYGPIWVVDTNEKRLETAARLGAPGAEIVPVHLDGKTDAAKAIRNDCPDGVEVAVDAVGRRVVRTGCAAAVRRGGSVLLLGLGDTEVGVDALDAVRRELRLQASYAYTPADFAWSKKLIESGRVDITPWTECLPLAEGQHGFETLASDPGATLKFLLQP